MSLRKQYLETREEFKIMLNCAERILVRAYADWCERHGFLYANKYIPDEWLEEPEVEMRIEETKDD